MKHALEAFTDLKLYLFMVRTLQWQLHPLADIGSTLQIMTFCANAGASASNVFGPIILKDLIGVSLFLCSFMNSANLDVSAVLLR